MRMRVVLLLAVAGAFAAGCDQGPKEDDVSSDTTAVRGADTVGGQVLPTMDTVIRTTTTEVEVDTIHGKGLDSVRRDTTRH